jgi:hypothetical protein
MKLAIPALRPPARRPVKAPTEPPQPQPQPRSDDDWSDGSGVAPTWWWR